MKSSKAISTAVKYENGHYAKCDCNPCDVLSGDLVSDPTELIAKIDYYLADKGLNQFKGENILLPALNVVFRRQVNRYGHK